MPDAGENESDDGKRFPSDLMARSHVPNFADNFRAFITTAAWKSKPSWMLVAGANSHKVEVAGAGHAVYVSRPKEVAVLIEEAASHNHN
jgi:hypothetical protein